MLEALLLVRQLVEALGAVALVVVHKVFASTGEAGVRRAVGDVAADVHAVGADLLLVALVALAVVVLGLGARGLVVVDALAVPALVALAVVEVEAGRELRERAVCLAGRDLLHVIPGDAVEAVAGLAGVDGFLGEGH